MDVLKSLLLSREDRSLQVQALLDCLTHADFNLQVCICSVGGVGSTELSNFLTQAGWSCNLLTDRDAVRHVNRPPAQLSASTKVIYLFGDPLAAVASHYRRNHALHQAQKTCSQPGKLDAATFPATFQEYVTRGEDLFGLQQHLDNWLQTPSAYDVLFARYERMFDLEVSQALFNHLGAPPPPPPQPQHNPAAASSSSGAAAAACHHHQQQDPQLLAATWSALRRERASRVTDEQRQQMYVQLMAQMDALPPIFLRTADCHIKPLLSTPQHASS